MSVNTPHDVIIIGGGPAGLSAATLLGRCLRDVVICDAGRPRNECSPAMHAFLGFDGINPREFLLRVRKQLRKYATVASVKTTIADVVRENTLFVVRDIERNIWMSKAVLLATGLVDHLPAIPNIRTFYGTSVHHCPFCDGWENRGKVLGVIGADEPAKIDKPWSSDRLPSNRLKRSRSGNRRAEQRVCCHRSLRALQRIALP